ncbi:MAG: GNAT family N-acetyltransferase [Caldilineaceae bacterium]|nr:GNAT family N-acetyltransferase [Caldilineaceae bacterium]
MLKIRDFAPADAEAVSALIRQTMRVSNSNDYPLERLQPLIDYFSPEKVLLLSEERHCLVAEVDGCVVGTIALEGTELCTFFIAPSYQGIGIGSQLLAAIEAVALAAGIDTIRMDASLTGVEFYTRRGYRRTGGELEGTAGVQVGMEKRLAR